jgi:hypothetical protein
MLCNWNGNCRGVPVTLLLVICASEHIGEKYLCPEHDATYITYVEQGNIGCTYCGIPVTSEYLAKKIMT